MIGSIMMDVNIHPHLLRNMVIVLLAVLAVPAIIGAEDSGMIVG